jgi:hypothetical protein
MWADQSALFRITIVLKNQSSSNSIAFCLSSIIILMLFICYYKPPMLSFINKKKIG